MGQKLILFWLWNTTCFITLLLKYREVDCPFPSNAQTTLSLSLSWRCLEKSPDKVKDTSRDRSLQWSNLICSKWDSGQTDEVRCHLSICPLLSDFGHFPCCRLEGLGLLGSDLWRLVVLDGSPSSVLGESAARSGCWVVAYVPPPTTTPPPTSEAAFYTYVMLPRCISDVEPKLALSACHLYLFHSVVRYTE